MIPHEVPGGSDPIRPLDWLKIIPFEPAAASDLVSSWAMTPQLADETFADFCEHYTRPGRASSGRHPRQHSCAQIDQVWNEMVKEKIVKGWTLHDNSVAA